MGLFGGFKAKFSREHVAKISNKTINKNEVVCIGYKSYSEFEDRPPQIERKVPELVKSAAVRPNSLNLNNGDSSTSTHNAISSTNTNNPIKKKIAPKKQPVMTPVTEDGIEDVKYNDTVERKPKRVVDQRKPKKEPKSILKPKSAFEETNESTTTLVQTVETNSHLSVTTKTLSHNENVSYKRNSYTNGNESGSRNPLGIGATSSYAANLFFADDDEDSKLNGDADC